MRLIPQSFVIHRWCPEASPLGMLPIGLSRDGRFLHKAQPETVEAFRRMRDAARQDNAELIVLWAFRAAVLQQQQFEEAQQKYGRREALRWLAPPGYSEHQTGWALDVGDGADPEADDNPQFERTAAFRWLQKNAGQYGFELSFRPNNWQGVSYEPWHWRFVGTLEARRAFHPSIFAALGVWTRSWGEALARWM